MNKALIFCVAMLAGCVAEPTDPPADDPSDDEAAAECGGTEQIGVTDTSHSKGPANYDVLMGSGDVPRLDIVICEADFAEMSEDLEALTSGGGGPGGGPGGGGPGGGGPGGDFPEEDPIYVPATLSYDGQVWPQVGMRYKGNSTLSGAASSGIGKLPFRLSMDKYEDEFPDLLDQRFYGFKDLKFSSGYNDSSLQRDKLTSDLFRAADVPAAKGGFVRVYVDVGGGPVYWGLYTVFEDPAGELLDDWFGDDGGNAYKPDGTAATLASFVEADFEKKTNEDDADFSDVQALIAALNADDTDAAAWRAALEETLHMEGFIRYLAVNNLVGNWDAYGRMTHNYYLYGDPSDDGRLTWIPWDFNEAHWDGQGNRAAINVGMSNMEAGWPLLDAVADDPVYRAQYEAEVADLLVTAFSQEAEDARIEENRDRIAEWAAAERAPYTAQTQDFDAATDAISAHVSSQRSEAAAVLAR